MQRPLLLLIILSIALSGCFAAVAPKTINITVEASKTTISPDETVVLTASVAENGKPLVVEESQIAWELSNTSTAQLSSSTGRQVTLTALTSGSVTITAVYGKHRSQALTITVTEPEPPPPDLENAIKIATQLIQSTEVGTEPGQAPQEAHDALQAAIVPDEEPGPVDTSDLENAIQIATHLIQSTEVGTEPGQAPQEAHDALQDAIDAAQAVLENEAAAQAEVD
ncbi:MAG: Ig-like domain-containing protein, partial [Limnochordia bacterium]